MPDDAQEQAFARLLAEAQEQVHRAAFNAWMDVPPFVFRRPELQPLWSALEHLSAVKIDQQCKAREGRSDGE